MSTDQNINFKEVDFDPFEKGQEIEKIISTNEPQKEIWLSCILGADEANLAYNESVSLELRGALQPDLFLAALREVVDRHEALNAVVSNDGELLIIHKNTNAQIAVIDISAEAAQKDILGQFIGEEMNTGFDLENGPLYRFFLHKLDDQTYYFTFILHHIIADGWSNGVILYDLSKIYNAKVTGVPHLLEPAPQPDQYVIEQIAFENTAAFQATKDYWQNLYQSGIPVIDMITDFPRPDYRTYRSKRIDYKFPIELIEKIKKTGAKAGSSLVNTFLSAYEIFVYSKTNQKSLIIGLPFAGQAITENFSLVGHCVNLLPLKSTINPDHTFLDYLKERKTAFYDAYENQRITFAQLIKLLNIKRDHSRIPLIDIVFNIDLGMNSSVEFKDLSYELIPNPRVCETFEISLNITGSESAFTLEWSYNTQLYKPETIEAAAAEFEQLLITLTDRPTTTLREVANASAAPWMSKLKDWNTNPLNYDKDSSFTELIADSAKIYPNKTAISFGCDQLSYSRLMELSDHFAASLIARGVKKGDIIGVAIDRSTAMVVTLISILKAGAAYLPLDPEYPQERIEYMLEDSAAKLLIISKTYTKRFHSATIELAVEDIYEQIEKQPLDYSPIALKGTDLAYILYTSGSTGKPKGVKIRHQGLTNLLKSMQIAPGIKPEDRLAATTTISFDIAAVELFLPLITGAELVICDRETARDARLLVDVIQKGNISVMFATPSTWSLMIDTGWKKPSSIKMLCGGEALSKELAGKLLLRSDELWNMYGPTETTVCSVLKRICTSEEEISIGWPIHNTQIYILDEDLQLVSPGKSGEVFIGGDGVAEGYLNRDELTNERFINDPFTDVPGARLYRTGDLGKFKNDGDIEYLGRLDQQVKIRGLRIELGEIESVLLAQKEIRQAVVIVREDHPGDKRLVAYVVLSDNQQTEIKAEIQSWKDALNKLLPVFMVPADYVVMDSFPLTPNLKLDKKALPPPAENTGQLTKSIIFPQNETEELIAKIWSEVLKIKDISIDDDFFELGGHSMLAVKVMTAIEKATGKRLPLATLFKNSTIKRLAQRIHSTEAEEWTSLVPIKTSGTKLPVYLIHGGGLNVLLFASISRYMDPDQPVYGLQAIGLNKVVSILPNMEEIAALYVSEIVKSNPNGPYCLAGYSLGGKIVFEMARQLMALGKEVKFLGIIDTNVSTDEPHGLFAELMVKFKRQFRKIPFFFHSFLKYPKEAIEYQITMTRRRVNQFRLNYRENDTVNFNDYEMEIYNNYEIAYSNYKLLPIDLKIDLFRVSKRLYYLDDRIFLGWSKLTTVGVEIHEIPGDHRTYLYPPNDQGFARILQHALDKL